MKKFLLFVFIIGFLTSCSSLSKPIPQGYPQLEGCVLFLHDPSGKSELWFSCGEQEPQRLLDGISGIKDYAVSENANDIYFSLANDSGGIDIWIASRETNAPILLVNCGSAVCEALAYNQASDLLAYSEIGQSAELKILNILENKSSSYSYSASDIVFSPNGKYLSFFDKVGKKLVVINLMGGNDVSVDSEEAMTGNWSSDSMLVLYGVNDYWGGLPAISLNSLSVETGDSKTIFRDTQEMSEYFHPVYFQSAGEIITGVRNPNTGFTRQILLLNYQGEVKQQITSDYTYDNSAIHLNESQTKLVFQRYAPGRTDSQPEIWIYNFKKGEIEKIASNASKPLWVP